MALEMDYTDPNGNRYPNCYIVITSIVFVPDNAAICTNWYHDKSEWDAGLMPFQQPAYTTSVDTFDTLPVFTAAYDYLLTLPEYAGAQIVP